MKSADSVLIIYHTVAAIKRVCVCITVIPGLKHGRVHFKRHYDSVSVSLLNPHFMIDSCAIFN